MDDIKELWGTTDLVEGGLKKLLKVEWSEVDNMVGVYYEEEIGEAVVGADAAIWLHLCSKMATLWIMQQWKMKIWSIVPMSFGIFDNLEGETAAIVARFLELYDVEAYVPFQSSIHW